MFLLYVPILMTVAMYPAEVISTDCVHGEMTPTADCKGYYVCVYGVQTKMADCTEGLFFSASVNVCVTADSPYNDCQVTLSIAEKCQINGGVYPHPTQCHAFYNCSVNNTGSYYYSQLYMQECSYPTLFNAETNKCDDFENVKCGDRVEYTNACDYDRNGCPVAHCIPCYVRFPNCDGKPDGMAPHEYKLWSPYFTICYKQRTMGEKTCPPDGNGRTQLLHPSLNLCVSLDLIPKSHGGLLSDCTGKPDGNNPDDFGRCNYYTVCNSGYTVATIQCKAGELFDTLLKKCVEASQTCGPCGQREDC